MWSVDSSGLGSVHAGPLGPLTHTVLKSRDSSDKAGVESRPHPLDTLLILFVLLFSSVKWGKSQFLTLWWVCKNLV